MVVAWRAAIVATHLDVGYFSAGRPNRRGWVLLLDVHVEGIEGHTTGFGIKSLDDFEGLFDGVDQTRLIAIQRLNSEPYLSLFGVDHDGLERLHQAIDCAFTLGR